MSRFIIYPYSMKSKSAKLLAEGLGALRVYPDRNYIPKSNDIIINWGNSHIPIWYRHIETARTFINSPRNISLASNKKLFFSLSNEVGLSVPENTTRKDVANSWIDAGHTVFCRTLLNSHGGRGIVVSQSSNSLVEAPLYTKEVKKEKEYRVHIFKGKVIDFTKKKRKREFSGDPPSIWNHENGFIFAREGVLLPSNMEEESIKAIRIAGLDFGAVDICIEKDTGKAIVFEVNTAPGIVNTTVERYCESLKSLSEEL